MNISEYLQTLCKIPVPPQLIMQIKSIRKLTAAAKQHNLYGDFIIEDFNNRYSCITCAQDQLHLLKMSDISMFHPLSFWGK